ncbi:hypothetical protein ACQ4PT_009952 [Festuca glaucescens]
MALLPSYGPSVEQRSLRVPQQPLWLRHRSRGGPLVSHGDYPRPDNWGVLLCCAAATKPVSSASAWEQHLPVSRSGRHPSLALNKLQLPARAQGRAFCRFKEYDPEKGPPRLKPGNRSTLWEGINILKAGLGKMKHRHPQAEKEMLEGILVLEKFANVEHHYRDSKRAHDLLSEVVSPLNSDLENHNLEDTLEVSLRAMCQLLENAPGEIGKDLRRTISGNKKVKISLEKIRDCYHNAGALARKILAQLPSSPE